MKSSFSSSSFRDSASSKGKGVVVESLRGRPVVERETRVFREPASFWVTLGSRKRSSLVVTRRGAHIVFFSFVVVSGANIIHFDETAERETTAAVAGGHLVTDRETSRTPEQKGAERHQAPFRRPPQKRCLARHTRPRCTRPGASRGSRAARRDGPTRRLADARGGSGCSRRFPLTWCV